MVFEAKQGNASAQYSIGYIVWQWTWSGTRLPSSQDYMHAAENQGDNCAEDDLGVMYDQGQGVDQDYYYKAIEWYSKAADHGNVRAKSHLDRACKHMNAKCILIE